MAALIHSKRRAVCSMCLSRISTSPDRSHSCHRGRSCRNRAHQRRVTEDVVFFLLFLLFLAGLRGQTPGLAGSGLAGRLALEPAADPGPPSGRDDAARPAQEKATMRNEERVPANEIGTDSQRVLPAASGRTARTTRLARSAAEAWMACLALPASASSSGLGLAHLESGGLARLVQRRVPFRVPLFDALLANLEDLGARLAQLVGVLGCPRLGLGDGPVGILDRALGPRAALIQGPGQRLLHQVLVAQHQHDEEQHRGHCANQQLRHLVDERRLRLRGRDVGRKQENPGLLNEFNHAGNRFRSGGQISHFRREEPIFVSGQTPPVQRAGPLWTAICDCGHEARKTVKKTACFPRKQAYT